MDVDGGTKGVSMITIDSSSFVERMKFVFIGCAEKTASTLISSSLFGTTIMRQVIEHP